MSAGLAQGLENVNPEQIKSFVEYLKKVYYFKSVSSTNEECEIEELQEKLMLNDFRDFLISYNRLSEICFNDCVWDFTTRSVKNQEDKCISNCAEKYLKMNQRISQRFQEFQMIANENVMAAVQKSGGKV